MHVKLSGVVVQDFEEGEPRLMGLRNIMQRQMGEDGFTLIELIIVMAILAFLIGLAVPKYNGILNDSRIKAHNANVEMIQQAVELYAANTGTALKDINNIKDLCTNNYLREIPDNPIPKGEPYTVKDGIVYPTKEQ